MVANGGPNFNMFICKRMSDGRSGFTADQCGTATEQLYGLSHLTFYEGGQAPVPEPATMLLVGSGLAGLAAARRRRARI